MRPTILGCGLCLERLWLVGGKTTKKATKGVTSSARLFFIWGPFIGGCHSDPLVLLSSEEGKLRAAVNRSLR